MGKFCKPSCNSERSIFFLIFFFEPFVCQNLAVQRGRAGKQAARQAGAQAGSPGRGGTILWQLQGLPMGAALLSSHCSEKSGLGSQEGAGIFGKCQTTVQNLGHQIVTQP